MCRQGLSAADAQGVCRRCEQFSTLGVTSPSHSARMKDLDGKGIAAAYAGCRPVWPRFSGESLAFIQPFRPQGPEPAARMGGFGNQKPLGEVFVSTLLPTSTDVDIANGRPR